MKDNGSILLGPENGTTDSLREQIVCRIINHLSVESTIRNVTAIILVQTIKDSGNIATAKDWNNDGRIESAGAGTVINDLNDVAQYQAGFRRFNPSSTDAATARKLDVFCNLSNMESIYELTNGKKGRYNLGSDAITGEAKIIVSLKYNTSTQKWEIDKYEFAE